MKILIAGANGQLGKEIQKIIRDRKSEIGNIPLALTDAEVISVDIDRLDITNLNSVRTLLSEIRPNIVINCAAYTNVDKCETDIDSAFKVNALGPRNLAIICEELGAKLIHVSTDYVFSGENRKEQLREYDLTEPQSIYGITKLQGENYVKEFSSKYFIVRTAWLYGYEGNNFVYTMLKLGTEKDSLNVVNDQKGNPTNANDLAHHILKLADTEEYGTYHCTGKGECTWCEFAKLIMELSGTKCIVNPCTSDEFVRPAKRPAYSSLDNMMLRCTIGDDMREWEDALKSFISKRKNL